MKLHFCIFLSFILYFSSEARPHSGKKRQRKVVSPILGNPHLILVENAAQQLEESSLQDDQQLDQVIEKGKTIYRHPPSEKNGAVVFTRMADDSEKDVIVLDEEDHFRRSRKKRTYVVLRRVSNSNKYYVFIAYLRKHTLAKKGNTDLIEFEWDHWDARGSSRNKMVGFGWANCESTSYISCRSQYSVEEWISSQIKEDNEFPEYSSEQIEEQGIPGALPSSQDPDFEIVTKETKEDKTFDTAKYDYFIDLLNCPLQAKIVGYTVQILTEASITLDIAKKLQPDITGAPREGDNVDLSREAKTAAANALAARLKRFAGGMTVMGTMVQGMRASGRTAIVNPKAAVVGKIFFFGFFIIRKGKINQALTHQPKNDEPAIPEVNSNPVKLFEPSVVLKIANLTEKLGTTKNGMISGEHGESSVRMMMGRALVGGLGKVMTHGIGRLGDFLSGKDSEEVAAEEEKKKKEKEAMLGLAGKRHKNKNPESKIKEENDDEKSDEPEDLEDKDGNADIDEEVLKQRDEIIKKSKVVTTPKGDKYLKTSNGQFFHVHKGGKVRKISAAKFMRVMVRPGVKPNFDPQKELEQIRKKRTVARPGSKHHKHHRKPNSHKKPHKKSKTIQGQRSSHQEPTANVMTSNDLESVSGKELIAVADKLWNDVSISALGNRKLGRSNVAASIVPGTEDIAIGQGLDALMHPEKAKKPSFIMYAGQAGRVAYQLPTKNEIANVFDTDADLFSKVGWISQDFCLSTLSKSLASPEEEPFTGLGVCPYKKLTVQDAKTPEEVVQFYLNILRTGCSPVLTNSILKLIDEGCLQLKSGHNNLTLALTTTCPLMTKPKLTLSENIQLSLAFEIAVFSQTFFEEAEEVDRTSNKPHSLSRSVRTLKKIAMLTFEKAGKLVPQHYVKLTRNLVLTLKSALVKSLQDVIRVKNCNSCTPDQRDQVRNDAGVLGGLIWFITTELEPEEGGQAAFEAFYKKSYTYIQEKLTQYI